VPARSFVPNRVGSYECDAWVAYYRRQWARLLVVSVGLVRSGFRMRWDRTLHGAWLVLRANQLWARLPVNDADGARRCMERFYRLVAADTGESLDTVEAARLEVEWWRVHREHQHAAVGEDEGDGVAGDGGDGGPAPGEALVGALVDLYAFVYRCPPPEVRAAAELRARAMDVSDRWVALGCATDSPLVAHERALLVRSYAALLAAVHR
jgi:hypothetical protein